VLAHELAHVRQQDGALQIAGELLRALHWFNPLVWLACHRLRQESEYAADDAVLNAGTDASDYASQLLAVARHARGLNRAWVAAPGIAHPSTLERRITAMLNPRRNRGPLTRRTVAATSLAAVIVVIPLAACSVARTTDPLTPPAAVGRDVALQAAPLADYRKARLEAFFHPATHAGRRAEAAAEGGSPGIDTSTPRAVASPNPAASTANANAANAAVAAPQAGAAADDQSGTFVGSVKDATGAVLPGATVTMTSTDLQVQRQTTSDANGSFMFRNLAPAQYAIAVSLAGFDTITAVMAVPPRLMVGRSFALPLGEITQNVTVRCGTQAAAVSSTNDATDSTRARSEALDRLYDALRRITQQVSPTLSAQSAPVRVGGQIQPPRKIADVLPVCPAPPDMDTSVVLVGRIGTDGALRGVRPITPRPANASPSQALVQSAVDAVNQWMFTPALLNGQKVEVDVTIQVTFRPGTVVHISLF